MLKSALFTGAILALLVGVSVPASHAATLQNTWQRTAQLTQPRVAYSEHHDGQHHPFRPSDDSGQ